MKPRARQLYRRVAIGAWSELRGMTDAARLLYLFVRTGPCSSPIPGVSAVGKAAIAEELGWPTAKVERAAKELVDAGLMAVDWTARLIWCSRGPIEAPPENPNQVLGWRSYWGLVPDSTLRVRIRTEIRVALENRGPDYLQAWDEVVASPTPNVGRNVPPNHDPNLPPNVRATGSGSGSGGGSGERWDVPPPSDEDLAALERALVDREATAS